MQLPTATCVLLHVNKSQCRTDMYLIFCSNMSHAISMGILTKINREHISMSYFAQIFRIIYQWASVTYSNALARSDDRRHHRTLSTLAQKFGSHLHTYKGSFDELSNQVSCESSGFFSIKLTKNYILTHCGPTWGQNRPKNLAHRDHFSHIPESTNNVPGNKV